MYKLNNFSIYFDNDKKTDGLSAYFKRYDATNNSEEIGKIIADCYKKRIERSTDTTTLEEKAEQSK